MTKQYSRDRHVSPFLLGTVFLLAANPAANAFGPVETPPTWGGDLASRPRLSGNWGGARDELAKKGVVLDADMYLLPQGVITGGKNSTADFWGNVDYSLNLDMGKMGLWPGGFFKFQGVSSFGNSLFNEVGAVVPTNVSYLFPGVNEADNALMEATFTQFFSTHFGVFMGKINTLGLTPTEFYGNYRTQFSNTALNFSLATSMMPISAYGGGILLLPTENITIAAMALDASGKPTENNVDKAFDDGATVLTSASIKIKPFGLAGNQTVTGLWSDKSRLSLDQDPNNIGRMLLNEQYPRLLSPGPELYRILAKYFPELLVPIRPANRTDSTWAVMYGFDQYLWQPEGEAHKGIGLFFNFGATDGNPNPIQYTYLMGIGGKGVVPGRSNDSFGVGWARTQFSDQFVPLLRQQLNLGLDKEDAIEMYYTASVTPWFSVSPNLQVVNSAMNKTLDNNGELQDLDVSLEASLRMNIKF